MREVCTCLFVGILCGTTMARPWSKVETPHCYEIRKMNGGCDPACGFVFMAAKEPPHEKKCVKGFPTTTSYCEELSKETKYAGCSKVCGLEWSADHGVCEHSHEHSQQSEGDIWSPYCKNLQNAPNFGCDASCGYRAGFVSRYHDENSERLPDAQAAADAPNARHSSHRECVVAEGESVPRTPYCEVLSKPKYTGCSLACGFFHTDALQVPCEKKKLKEEL